MAQLCTWARACSPVIQWYPLRAPSVAGVAESGFARGFVASAIFPSRVIADFSVTSGLPLRMYLANLHSASWLPPRISRPVPRCPSRAAWQIPAATSGFGSCMEQTTRRIPAATTASAHGPVRPDASMAPDSGREFHRGLRRLLVSSASTSRASRGIGMRTRANFAARGVRHDRAHGRIGDTSPRPLAPTPAHVACIVRRWPLDKRLALSC